MGKGNGELGRRSQGRRVRWASTARPDLGTAVRLVVWLAMSHFLFPLSPHAQTRRVEILNADFVEVATDSLTGVVRTLTGDVRLRQDTTTLAASRAVYYEARGEVVMDGAVRVVSGRDTLTAATLTYDSNTKVSVAEGDVRVADGESVLLAPRATYDGRAEVSAFEGGGTLMHRGAVLTSPSGTYSSARRFAQFDGPVRLVDSTGTLDAARGTYDARVQRADFAGDVYLRRPDAALDADSVVYFRRTERGRAFGRAVLERVGEGPAARIPEAPADSSRRTFLFGETIQFDGQAETASVRGEPAEDGRPGRDPLLLVLRADSTGRVDSTLVRAPRIDASRVPAASGDTLDVVVAAGGARLWGRQLAAVADSARFARAPGPDPLDRLSLRGARRPSVWADGSQITGDSLFADAAGGAVQDLRVEGRAFAARLDSTLGRLHQIAGARMRGAFDGDELRRLGVGPNAQVLYFRASPEGLLAGADEVAVDTLVLGFEGGDLRTVAGDRGVSGTIYGPTNVPEGRRLPGFAYDAAGAPTRAGVLGDGWEVGWLERYGPGARDLRPAPLAEPVGEPVPADAASGAPEPRDEGG